MALWHFSIAAFAFEFLTASVAAQTFYHKEATSWTHLKIAYSHLCKQFGSVVLAAALVPPCRAIAHILHGGYSVSKLIRLHKVMSGVMFLCRYQTILRVMNSNGVALSAISGLSFTTACYEASKQIDARQEDKITSVESSELIIWLNQLVVMLIGPVFVMYWILHEDDVFQDASTEDVTSLVAMGLFSLVFTWFLAQVYAAYARGTIHGTIVAYVLDLSADTRVCGAELRDFLDGPKSLVQKPNRAPTPDKDSAKKAKPTPEGPPQSTSKPTPQGPTSAPPPTRNGDRSSAEMDASANVGEGDQLIPVSKARPQKS